MSRRRLTLAVVAASGAALAIGVFWMSRRPGRLSEEQVMVGARDVCASIGDASRARPPNRTRLAKELGGDAVLAVLEKPDRGGAIRVVLTDGLSWGSPDTFPSVGQSVPIGGHALRQLSCILSYERSWDFNRKSGGLPEQWVRFQFEGGGHVVNVFLSYEGDMSVTYLDGVQMGWQNPYPSAPKLLEFASELFPGDPALRAVGAEHRGR